MYGDLCAGNYCQDVEETAWPELEPHPRDVILLVKYHIHSEAYSQPPMVFCPHVYLERLPCGPVGIAAHTRLSSRQLHEFTNTANKVESRPWMMDKAAAWLRTWMNGNTHNESDKWCPPDINWVLAPTDLASRIDSIPSTLIANDVTFAVRRPGEGKIQNKKRKHELDDALPHPELQDPGLDGGMAGAPALAMEMGAPQGRTAAPSSEAANGGGSGLGSAKGCGRWNRGSGGG